MRENNKNYHPIGKSFLSKSLQNEVGGALIVALLVMIVLISLVPVAMQMTSGEFQRTKNFKENQEVFYMAEAALEHGKSIVQSTDINTILAGPDGDKTTLFDNGTVAGVGLKPDNATYTWNGLGYEDVVMAHGGAYLFRIHDNDDGDGDEFKDKDSLVVVEGIGTNGSGEFKTVYAMVEKKDYMPSSLPSALTMTGPNAVISSNNTNFNVRGASSFSSTGKGYELDGSVDSSCDGKSAITTEATGTLQQVGENNEGSCSPGACMAAHTDTYSKYVGVGGSSGSPGSPSVVPGQTEFTADDVAKLRSSLVATGVPDHVFNASVTNVDSSTPLGTASDPVIAHFNGEAKITGSVDGYGILIIDGDLNIDNSIDTTLTFNWDGLIIIGACSTCSGKTLVGGGTTSVDGAIIMGGGALRAKTGSPATNFTGTANIRYSCKGVEMANNLAVPPFKVVGWNYRDMTGSAAAPLTAGEDDDGTGGVCNGGSSDDDDDGVSNCATVCVNNNASGDDDDGGCGLGGDQDDD